jgi:Uma2 family endonuclease
MSGKAKPGHIRNTPFPVRNDGKCSVEEFFAFIEPRPEEEHWQLIDGEPMCLPRPTLAHQRIASNLMLALNGHFRSCCPSVCACFGVGLMVPEAGLFRARADVAVLDATLDATAGSESYADRFYCVAEILSDSNTDKDVAVKRQRYLQHSDNLYFLLIEQKRVRVEVLARARGWAPTVLERLEDELELPEFGFRMPVADLYRGTPLAAS